MKNSPKVSCIMTTFNSEKFLQESIESILNQTFTDFEFIVSDWGSSDNTVKIIKDYQKKDSRIILLENKRRKWIADCLNDCMKIAKGKYIAVMESDDYSYSNRFEILYNISVEKNLDFVIPACNEWFNLQSKKITTYLNDDFKSIKYCVFNPPITVSWVFKKSLYDSVREFWSYTWDIRFFYDIFLNPDRKLQYLFINDVLYFKRENPNWASTPKKFFDELFNNRIRIINKYRLQKGLKIKTYFNYYKYLLTYYWIKISKKFHVYSVISYIWRRLKLNKIFNWL